MAFQAIIFDLDGTLLDTLEDIGSAGNWVLAEKGFPTHPLDSYRQFIGEGVAQLVLRVLPENHRDDATVQSCIEAYRKEYSRTWNVKTKPYPGVPEMLDALVSSKFKLAVLSNKPDEFTQRCVHELLPRWKFQAVIGASDEFPKKPNPASALEIARRLGVGPGECLYVGDSGVDMKTAVAAGMFAVGVLWGFRGQEELLREGARCLIEQPLKISAIVEKSQTVKP